MMNVSFANILLFPNSSEEVSKDRAGPLGLSFPVFLCASLSPAGDYGKKKKKYLSKCI